MAADSTSTYMHGFHPQHFSYGQKLFEVGEHSSVGIITWGMGGLSTGSHRTLIARLADDLKMKPPSDLKDVATRWSGQFWQAYSASSEIAQIHALSAKPPCDPTNPMDPSRRTWTEEAWFGSMLRALPVGFCVGGYVENDRTPAAFEVFFDPLHGPPSPTALPPAQSFWGVPSFIGRLINGCAAEVRSGILGSGKWNGTEADLDSLIAPHKLVHPSTVPIREAIDFTHACLYATIKALKFSGSPRVCGGPIEIAVITTDRPFRWVQHKPWDVAIKETLA